MSIFRLGDLGKIVTGKTPAAANPEHFGSEIPFLTPTDINGVARHFTTGRFLSTAGARAFQRLLLPPQSVCCVCIGATIGKVCLTQGITASNQQINSIIVDQTRHDPRFIFYKLLTLGEVLKARAGGAATPIVNKSQFSDLEVELPDLAVQSRIAHVLSAYDDLIENNTRRIAILEEMARRIFDFVLAQAALHDPALRGTLIRNIVEMTLGGDCRAVQFSIQSLHCEDEIEVEGGAPSSVFDVLASRGPEQVVGEGAQAGGDVRVLANA